MLDTVNNRLCSVELCRQWNAEVAERIANALKRYDIRTVILKLQHIGAQIRTTNPVRGLATPATDEVAITVMVSVEAQAVPVQWRQSALNVQKTPAINFVNALFTKVSCRPEDNINRFLGMVFPPRPSTMDKRGCTRDQRRSE